MTKPKTNEAAAQHPPHGGSGLFKAKEPRPLDRFDYDALAALPDEGAMKGRYMRDALTALQLKRKLDAGELSPSFVSVRLRDLRDQGLVVSYAAEPGSKGKHVWQRTDKGRRAAMAQVPTAKEAAGS